MSCGVLHQPIGCESFCLLCDADKKGQNQGDYIEWPSDDRLGLAMGMPQITAPHPRNWRLAHAQPLPLPLPTLSTLMPHHSLFTPENGFQVSL